MRLCPCWAFILLIPAVRLTCAVCLGPPDGRVQQLLRRDCTLSHAWAGICVKATQVSSVEDFLCVLQHYCNTGTQTTSSSNTTDTHRTFIFPLTVNHSPPSLLKAFHFLNYCCGGTSMQSKKIPEMLDEMFKGLIITWNFFPWFWNNWGLQRQRNFIQQYKLCRIFKLLLNV